MQIEPITGTGTSEPHTIAELDPRAEVRLDVDRAEGLTLTLADGDVEVYITLPKSPEAWHLVRSLARRIEEKAPDVKAANLRFALGEPVNTHGPVNGPGVWT